MINSKEFLKEFLDDLIIALALPRGSRIINQDLYRKYQISSIVINIFVSDCGGNRVIKTSDLAIAIDIHKVATYIHPWKTTTRVAQHIIPIADPELETKAVEIINGAIGSIY